jgi:hypothetical protein
MIEIPLPPFPLQKCLDTIDNVYKYPKNFIVLNAVLLISFGLAVMAANLVYLFRYVLKIDQKRGKLAMFGFILVWNALMVSAGGVLSH